MNHDILDANSHPPILQVTLLWVLRAGRHTKDEAYRFAPWTYGRRGLGHVKRAIENRSFIAGWWWLEHDLFFHIAILNSI